jgi:hypothetical protein
MRLIRKKPDSQPDPLEQIKKLREKFKGQAKVALFLVSETDNSKTLTTWPYKADPPVFKIGVSIIDYCLTQGSRHGERKMCFLVIPQWKAEQLQLDYVLYKK